MPVPDTKFKEVLIVLVVCMLLFLILAAVILLFLYLYQRRRLLQQKEVMGLQQQFKEQSMKAQLEIQEQTFRAISEEIHDNVGQLLSLARVQISIVDESERLDKGLLQAARESIGKAMTDLRDLSKSLNSERVRTESIFDTLHEEVGRINRGGILRAELAMEGVLVELESRKKLILFRIIQECIQNCIKHAEATELQIGLSYLPEGIRVCIRDNGKGFDPTIVKDGGGGQGLDNIRNRVRLTGGTHEIDSQAGKGTQIILTIPYE